MGAGTFHSEHGAAAVSLAASVKRLEHQFSQLSSPPTRMQLQALARNAGMAHGDAVRAGRWNIAGQGEEGAEEEDVPRAETQVVEGADALTNALSALQSYARASSASTRARYERELAAGRTEWNEGIFQLWFLAHRSNAPTV